MWCRVSGSLSPGLVKVADKHYFCLLHHNLQKKQLDEEFRGPPDPSARLLKVTVAEDGDGSQSWLEKVAGHEVYLYIHHFGKRSKASDLNGHNFNSVVFI